MFGWTLVDTLLGGDAVELLGIEYEPEPDDEEEEVVLPDYAEILQAHGRNRG